MIFKDLMGAEQQKNISKIQWGKYYKKRGSKGPEDIYTAGSYLPILGRSEVLACFMFELWVFYHHTESMILQILINDEWCRWWRRRRSGWTFHWYLGLGSSGNSRRTTHGISRAHCIDGPPLPHAVLWLPGSDFSSTKAWVLVFMQALILSYHCNNCNCNSNCIVMPWILRTVRARPRVSLHWGVFLIACEQSAMWYCQTSFGNLSFIHCIIWPCNCRCGA